MGVISLTSGFLMFIFYLPVLIGGWEQSKVIVASRAALRDGTLATQGSGDADVGGGEIGGLMWADVGGDGGFGGGGGF